MATVYIHGGDYDCSELVRMCYRAVGVIPYGSYMWTGNEVELLESCGFVECSLASPQMGDVLWRTGHTEIYLGDGMQGGARHGDYAGGLDGRKGDQDGTEITRSKYRAGDWSKLLRYVGGMTVDGIPAAVAAALVADHIIDDNSHGYSQPNRAGDGTVEAVTISWDGTSSMEVCPVSYRYKFKRSMAIRTAPSPTAKKVGTYLKGQTVIIEGMGATKDGRFWGVYTGASSGQRRYVCIGDTGNRGEVLS